MNWITYFGPPGTGKTTRLTAEVARCAPRRFVYVSHTRRAATEAKARAGYGTAADYRTLHSLAYRELGVRAGDLLEWEDYRELGKVLHLRFSQFFDPDEAALGGQAEGDKLRALVDLAAARCQPVTATGVDPWRLERYVATLREYKADTGKMDFNDLLTRALALEPLLLDMAVVDEAQDLSTLQWQVVQKLFAKVQTVLVAGDDDQAIFTWAGADVSAFLALRGTCEVLARSYRCPVAVHALAQRIAGRIISRQSKTWMARAVPGEVREVADLEQVDVERPGTHLLLARNNYLLAEWVRHLRTKGVLYRLRGRSAVNGDHLRQIIEWGRAYPQGPPWFEGLRLPPSDVAFYRACLARNRDLRTEPTVTVTTIHGAKGAEADHVAWLTDRSYQTELGAEHDPDAEHRVAYVAVTRARETLTVVRPRGPCAYRL